MYSVINKNNAANKIQKIYRKHSDKLYTNLVNEVYNLYENYNIKPINIEVLNVIKKCYIRLRKDDLNDLYFKEFLDNLYLYFIENNCENNDNETVDENNYLKFLVEKISEKYLVILFKRVGIKNITVNNYKNNKVVKNFLSDVVEEVSVECFPIEDLIRRNI